MTWTDFVLQMPDNAQPGSYTLRVEGSHNQVIGGNMFENETDIMFDIKQVSIFIETSKPLYKQGQNGMQSTQLMCYEIISFQFHSSLKINFTHKQKVYVCIE